MRGWSLDFIVNDINNDSCEALMFRKLFGVGGIAFGAAGYSVY